MELLQVSIYGHSLGSVLSYDILCHQESLSSPFPMDYVFTGCARNEESYVLAADQSSSTRNLEDKNVNGDCQTSELVSSLEGDISNIQPNATVNEEISSEFSVPVDHTPTSEKEETDFRTFDTPSPTEDSHASFRETRNFTESTDIPSSDEGVQELAHSSSDTFSLERESSDANPDINGQVPDEDTVKAVEDSSEDGSGKDKLITLLKEEVKIYVCIIHLLALFHINYKLLCSLSKKIMLVHSLSLVWSLQCVCLQLVQLSRLAYLSTS